MLQPTAGKIAWVTGAGSGIGEAAAIALAREGVKVALSGRRREALERTAASINAAAGESLVLPLDIRDEDAIRAAVEEIKRRYGRLDILFANAGINVPERRWNQISLASWREVIDIDLTGAFACIQAVLPMMREQQDG